MSVFIDTYLTPFFTESENLFNNSIVIMIDVLRASSTVATALQNGAREIIPTESLEKAVKIYANLSKEISFLGGERNGLKPLGFDAGNSPFEYTTQNVNGKSVILTTSNGTRIFEKAKNADFRLVGGFVNLSIISNFVIEKINENEKIKKIIFLCAGNDGKLSAEDMLCAGNFINIFKQNIFETELSDSSIITEQIYNIHSENYTDFLFNRDHSLKLQTLNFHSDIEYCLTKDICPIIPIISNSSIKKL